MVNDKLVKSADKTHLVVTLIVIVIHIVAVIEWFAHVVGDQIPKLAEVAVLIIPSVLLFAITNLQRRVKFKRFWRHVGKLLLLVAIAVTALILIPRSVVSSKLPVVIADLEDYTDDRAFSNTGGRTLLKLSLEQSPRIAVFPESRINETLHRMGKVLTDQVTPQIGREICQRDGVGPLITWSAKGSGAKYELNANILDPSSGSVLSAVEVGPFSDITLIEAIDVLGEKLRKRFGDSSLQIYQTTKPLMPATTSSLPALRAYTEATQHFYERRYAEAKTSLSKSLELDSNFAMALVEMASLYDLEGNIEAAAATAKRAFELRDKLTTPERVRVAEYYYWVVLNDHQKGFDEVYEFLKQYPRHQERLGTLVYQASALMKFDIAEEASWKILGPLPWEKFSREDAFALWRVQLSRNQFTQALETAKQMSHVPESNNAYLLLIPTIALADLEQEKQRMEEFIQAGNMEPVSWLSGVSDLYRGRLQSGTERWAQYVQLTSQRPKSDRRWVDPAEAYLAMARVALVSGKPDKAREYLAHVVDVREEYLVEAGKYYARAGDIPKANEVLSNLRARLGDRSTNQNRSLLLVLESEIELKKGNTTTSSSLLSQVPHYPWNYSYWQLQESRAYVSFATGNFEETIKVSKEMLDLKGFAFAWDRPDDWVMAHYYLGRAYESLGRKDLAISYYLDFQRIWEAGDPEIPSLMYTRTHLSELGR